MLGLVYRIYLIIYVVIGNYFGVFFTTRNNILLLRLFSSIMLPDIVSMVNLKKETHGTIHKTI